MLMLVPDVDPVVRPSSWRMAHPLHATALSMYACALVTTEVPNRLRAYPCIPGGGPTLTMLPVVLNPADRFEYRSAIVYAPLVAVFHVPLRHHPVSTGSPALRPQ